MPDIHIAITRQVQPGKEAEFEAALRAFARRSLHHLGTTGVHLLAPVAGDLGREYGILRSFESEAASHAFYASELYAEWEKEAAPLVVGEPILRRLHGLEAFFRSERVAPPPRWKMALLTWLGVFPTVLLWSRLLPPHLEPLHPIASTAVINLFVVITLAWGAMPLLTRVFARWLRPDALPS